jgi:sugar phosphate isomerase/epimerase
MNEKGSSVNVNEILRTVDTVLVIDWPSKEVPEVLAFAGLQVVVHGGPGPEDYSACEGKNGEVVERRTGREPERAELIYSYRPLSELPEIIATAKRLGAKTIWYQSGLGAGGLRDPKGCWVAEEELTLARNLVEAAGLRFIAEPYLGDVARELGTDRARHEARKSKEPV